LSRFDVYGLGNALVDMEFETSSEELAKLGVEKGVMTLVEASQQEELLGNLGREPTKRACGGSAANTVIAVAQFGGRSYYSCKVADDATGSFFLEDLVRNDVGTNVSEEGRQQGDTGKCLVLVTPDAERSMCTYLGITADLSENELDADALSQSSYLYIEGYLAPSDTARKAAAHARAIARDQGVRTAVSLSDPNMVKFCKAGLTEIVGDGVDLLFCNEREALDFTATTSVEAATQQLRQCARSLVITLGAKGSLVFDGQEETRVTAQKVTPIDTNGAGDMFAGAFLYGITNGLAFSEAARLANRASARLILEYGPRLDKAQAQAVHDEHRKAGVS
jgi:sugar/nucleoside kinase (ribokinase family)